MTESTQPKTTAPSLKDALTIRLEAEREYVPGLPMPMAITLRATQPGAVVDMLPEPTPFALGGSIGFVLSDLQGHKVASFEAPGVHNRDHDPPQLSLIGGEERRLLIDLSEVMPAQKPGRYRLVVSYEAPARRTKSAPVEISFRQPTDAEKAWIAAHLQAVEEAGSWGRWTTLPPSVAVPPTPAPRLARFAAVCRVLFHDAAPLNKMDPAMLALVEGIAKPEVETMQIEVLAARGETQAAGQLARTLRTSYPALEWRVHNSESRAGILGVHRP